MNNKEFIAELSRRLGYTNKDTARMVSSLLGIMTQELQDGNTIAIQGFGTFEVSERAAREGRNPQTGETMKIAASKAPKFKAGKALKDVINK